MPTEDGELRPWLAQLLLCRRPMIPGKARATLNGKQLAVLRPCALAPLLSCSLAPLRPCALAPLRPCARQRSASFGESESRGVPCVFRDPLVLRFHPLLRICEAGKSFQRNQVPGTLATDGIVPWYHGMVRYHAGTTY